MNQNELISAIASVSGESKKTVEAVLKTAADVIAAELYEGNEAKLPGLGRLHPHAKKARTGRNPRTGEAMTIAARNVVVFSAAKPLKDAINPRPSGLR